MNHTVCEAFLSTKLRAQTNLLCKSEMLAVSVPESYKLKAVLATNYQTADIRAKTSSSSPKLKALLLCSGMLELLKDSLPGPLDKDASLRSLYEQIL